MIKGSASPPPKKTTSSTIAKSGSVTISKVNGKVVVTNSKTGYSSSTKSYSGSSSSKKSSPSGGYSYTSSGAIKGSSAPPVKVETVDVVVEPAPAAPKGSIPAAVKRDIVITKPKLTINQQITENRSKTNLEKGLINKGYEPSQVKSFVKEFENSPSGRSYKITEKITGDKAELVVSDVKAEQAQKRLEKATVGEKMILYGSTVMSEKGVDVIGATVAGGDATKIVKQHMIDSQSKGFETKTAIGSVTGSPYGILATSMATGAVFTGVTKSATAAKIATSFPKIVIGGKVAGAGMTGAYAYTRGSEMYEARNDKARLASLGIRTGLEIGGFIIGSNWQSEMMTKPKIDVTRTTSETGMKYYRTKQGIVEKGVAKSETKIGEQTVTKTGEIKIAETKGNVYGGTIKKGVSVARKPRLDLGKNVYQEKVTYSEGTFSGVKSGSEINQITQVRSGNTISTAVSSGSSKLHITAKELGAVKIGAGDKPQAFLGAKFYKTSATTATAGTSTYRAGLSKIIGKDVVQEVSPVPKYDISSGASAVFRIPTRTQLSKYFAPSQPSGSIGSGSAGGISSGGFKLLQTPKSSIKTPSTSTLSASKIASFSSSAALQSLPSSLITEAPSRTVFALPTSQITSSSTSFTPVSISRTGLATTQKPSTKTSIEPSITTQTIPDRTTRTYTGTSTILSSIVEPDTTPKIEPIPVVTPTKQVFSEPIPIINPKRVSIPTAPDFPDFPSAKGFTARRKKRKSKYAEKRHRTLNMKKLIWGS